MNGERITARDFVNREEPLAKLLEVGPCSQNHLGRLIYLDAATIKGVVDRLSARGFLRKLVGVAAEIGIANDFIALIVMTQNDAVAAKSLASPTNTFVHGVIGENEIIFQTANWRCRSQCHVSAFSFG